MRFIFVLFLLISSITNAQLSKKHWIPPIHARDGETFVNEQYVYLSTPEPTPFQVSVLTGNGTPLSGSPFTISSGNPKRVVIGSGQPSIMFVTQNETNVVRSTNGLILEGAKEFYATFKVKAQNHAEILVAKGYQGLGTEFRLGSLPQSYDGAIRNFFASFMATEDNTTVQLSDYDINVDFVSPTGNVTANQQTFTLNAGQSVTVSGYTSNANNLTGFIGALLTSDKPIAVNSGNALAGMTSPEEGQDFTFDQIVPIEEIGTEYIVVKGNGSNEVERPLVIATQDNTSIYINGSATPLTTINTGDYYLLPSNLYQGINNKNMYISSSKPVYLYQILGGSSSNATSGLNFIPPLSCFFQKKVDLIPSIDAIGFSTYASEIIALTYTGSILTINGTPTTALPEPALGNPTWSTYRIPGYTGNVVIESTGPLAVGVFGASGAVGFAGYYSGFGSTPKNSIVKVCSETNTDLFDLIEGNPDPGGIWNPPLTSGTGVFNPNIDSPGDYVYTFTGLCETLNITVNVTVEQGLNPGEDNQINVCINDSSFDLFPLLGSNAEIGGTWSPALSSGGSIFNPAVDPSGIYVYSINNSNVCGITSSSINVTVNPIPTTISITDYELCDDTTDGNDSNGLTTFNLNTKTPEILNGQTGITVTYHQSQNDAELGINSLNTIHTGNTTIYARLKNNLTQCYNTVSFNLIVHQLPVLTNNTTLKQCDDNQDAITAFNLTEAETILTDQTNLTFSYFENQTNAVANINAIANTLNYISGSKTIWIRITNSNGCYRITPLNLIVSTTQIPSGFVKELKACDIERDLNDLSNDGFEYFDLNEATADLINLFPATQSLTVTYYENAADALMEINPIPLTQPYRNTVPNSQTLFVRIDSNISNDCVGFGPNLLLTVDPIPEFDLGNNFVLCVNPSTGLGSQTVDATPTTSGLYQYFWSPPNTNLDSSGNESPLYSITQGGTYTVTVTNTLTNCSNSKSIDVTVSSEPEIIETSLLTPLFSAGLSTIQVSAIGGFGTYEYSIDGVNWQDNGIFSGLENGSYIFFVRDLNQCGVKLSKETFTVTYPNFFTPNGDGQNDTWNIQNLKKDYQSQIFIFDRYGKLLKEISTNGEGWDGTYNGNLMPSNDYWFKVEYTENNTRKEFKSHFTLKR